MNPLSKYFYLDSKRVVSRLALPSNRWLKRPAPNASRRYHPFNPRPLCALAPTASFCGPLCFRLQSPKSPIRSSQTIQYSDQIHLARSPAAASNFRKPRSGHQATDQSVKQKHERRIITHPDRVRNLASPSLLPFVKPIDRNETTAPIESPVIRRF